MSKKKQNDQRSSEFEYVYSMITTLKRMPEPWVDRSKDVCDRLLLAVKNEEESLGSIYEEALDIIREMINESFERKRRED